VRGLGAVASGIVVALLLRSTMLAALAVRGLVLDVLAFATVMWGLRGGAAWGASFGFAVGLCADLDAAHWLGRHALALTLIGYVVGRLSRTLVRDSPRTHFALVVLATSAHQAWAAAFDLGGFVAWREILLRVVVGAVATGALGVLVLWVPRRFLGAPWMGHGGVQPGKTT
jgi:rod shape-determining protein MreD